MTANSKDSDKTPELIKPVIEPAKPSEPKYTKSALVNSRRFNGVQRDILNLQLDAKREYTIDDAKQEIEDFKKGI